ncbi:ATP-dependent DNA helicase [Cutibacterium acnes JCM 18909]|nr:ATP-dependent DNA helicase [Cutibacterium acnes JCM 18909]
MTLRQKRGGDRYADIDKWLSRVDEREELLDLVAAYQNLKKERGLVEFGDRMVQAST